MPDHLTSVFVDAGAVSSAREMVRLFQLAKRLRDPGGCPWDAEQTHRSLTRYLLEESYEAVEAIEHLDAGRRTHRCRTSSATCSTRSCSTRCSRRRPASSPWPTSRAASTTSSCAATRTCSATSWPTRPSDVMRNWEQIKKEEKGTTSIVDGITPGLPSLLYTHKLFRKAASVGLEPGDVDDALDRIDAALAASARRRRHRAGDLEADARAGAGRVGDRRPRRRRRRRVRAPRLGRELPPTASRPSNATADARPRRRPRRPLARPPPRPRPNISKLTVT